MTETRPQMGPGGHPEPESGARDIVSAPTASPPGAASKGDCSCSEGADGGAKSTEIAFPVMAGMGDAVPFLRPLEGLSAGVTAWQNNKRITGLWSINQNRNSWVHVEGIGWKKLASNSDSAIVALTLLSAHAREKGSVVNYREESDSMIRELYVW